MLDQSLSRSLLNLCAFETVNDVFSSLIYYLVDCRKEYSTDWLNMQRNRHLQDHLKQSPGFAIVSG